MQQASLGDKVYSSPNVKETKIFNSVTSAV